MIFPQHFLPALLVCFWKYCFERFFPPFFGHDIRVNIKKVFSQFFTTIFIPPFSFWVYWFVSGKIVSRVFPPHFNSRYSCNYKKRFFALFYDDFFPNIFCSHYWCVSGKIVTRVFSPPFFGHDIRVYIKNDVSQFFAKIFFQILFARTIC